jgi:hypothetical protein
MMAPTTNDAASTIEVFKVVSHLVPEWAVLIKPLGAAAELDAKTKPRAPISCPPDVFGLIPHLNAMCSI